MFTRRSFIKSSALAAGGLLLPWRSRRALAAIPGGTLPPGSVAKYVAPLIAPSPMPRTSRLRTADGQLVDYYEIAVRQFQQQVLPASHPATTVWSYGNPRFGRGFLYPAYSIEARHGIPVRVKWINQLVDSRGNFLPHLLPVDPTLHWANPPGPIDTRPSFESTPPPYTGPVPMVTHVHGAHTHEESDGYPEAWYLPQARNIPAGYAADGTWYDTFRERFRAKW
ncbi:MAG TPA: hypothetical protein VK911_11035, partial [Vicinamibacterales bacterium]|nr:hypothetical protein [Vicinamibacterales bacterium]